MTSVRPTAVRVLVTLLAIAATVGHLAYLDTLWWHALGLTGTVARDVSPGLIVLLTGNAIVSLVSGFLAVALVLHEGEAEEAARGLGAAFGAWSYLLAYSGVTMLLRPNPGLARDLFEGHFLLVEVVGLAGLLRFTSLFPRPLVAGEIDAPDGLPSVLLPAHTASVWMLRPASPWAISVLVLGGLWSLELASGRALSDAGLSPAMTTVRVVAAGLVVLNLRRAWNRADEAGRGRLQWLLVALSLLLGSVSLTIGGKVLVAVAGFREPSIAWHPLVFDLGMIGFLVGLAMSVLYRGPVAPMAVVRRVATLASVATVGLFLAAALEALLSGGLLVSFALRTGVGSALALATMVSTYRPFVRLVDRMMPDL